MAERPSLLDLKAAYARNENITRMLRSPGNATNDQSAILIAYDLQAGSYVAALSDPDHATRVRSYANAIADVLEPLQPRSILEPGVGEATTLRAVLERFDDKVPVVGVDLSWSRVHVGRRHLGARRVGLYVGELEALPLPDNAADIVYTSHAVEPNHGREEIILDELYRVTGRYLVLFEPAYELAEPEARKRMEMHGYCRGLHAIATQRGWTVKRHQLLPEPLNASNPTGLLLIEKRPNAIQTPFDVVCPSCRQELLAVDETLYCNSEGLAFPVLRGIPCLARHNAILANSFME
jgi:SAM-dependent methyltransferase